MTKPDISKTRTKFPTVIRDPGQVVDAVKKDLAWVGVATIISVAAAMAAFMLIKPA